MPSKPYHPPALSAYRMPMTDQIGYIRGESGAPMGFGSRAACVGRIPVAQAREMVIAHHYSHRVVNNSYLHLGVFQQGRIVGVMQFGYLLNPACCGRIVADTKVGEYLELNRMWLDDAAPRNSESRAISQAIKYIKVTMPTVAWIQSFADERCGGLGVVYQAANFKYLGHHYTQFYELDGETYHGMLLTAHKKGGHRGQYLRKNLDRAVKRKLRQFRHIYFIKRAWLPRLRFQVRAYPKPEAC